ncbi:MAG: ABC transporter substrate-binding protein [Deltaproteobacteria bacterium]|nr:ABC transporter substrate-binding protein [Candidatus Tharpella sp.]
MQKFSSNRWGCSLLIAVLLFSGVIVCSTIVSAKTTPIHHIRRIAVVVFATPFLRSYEGLRDGLASRGFKLDGDLSFDVYCLEQDISRVNPLMEKLATVDYDLIFSVTTPVTRAIHTFMLKNKIKTPVVFTAVADPLGSRIVDTLRHPGGNFTGVSHLSIELLPQRLLLFKKAFPEMQRVALIFDPDVEVSKRSLSQGFLRRAALDIGLKLEIIHVHNHNEMVKKCRDFTADRADGLFMLPDPLSVAHFGDLIKLSHRLKIPLMVIDNMLLQRGGVMGYSPDFYGVGVQAAIIVEQIFKGVSPGDIPVQNADKVNLVISLKEVKELGITINDEILLQADEVLR